MSQTPHYGHKFIWQADFQDLAIRMYGVKAGAADTGIGKISYLT